MSYGVFCFGFAKDSRNAMASNDDVIIVKVNNLLPKNSITVKNKILIIYRLQCHLLVHEYYACVTKMDAEFIVGVKKYAEI